MECLAVLRLAVGTRLTTALEVVRVAVALALVVLPTMAHRLVDPLVALPVGLPVDPLAVA